MPCSSRSRRIESTAVFGHEIGHVAHRHFLYFAFFFMGSLGVLSIFGDLVSLIGSAALAHRAGSVPERLHSRRGDQGGTLLVALGLYFWFVFGYLSRRFERQADVYGSKVVSCDMADCPPHTDLDNELAPEPAVAREAQPLPGRESASLPTRLTNVAQFNGLDRRNPILAARIDRQPDRIPRSTRTASGTRTRLPAAGSPPASGPGRHLDRGARDFRREPDSGGSFPELAFR